MLSILLFSFFSSLSLCFFIYHYLIFSLFFQSLKLNLLLLTSLPSYYLISSFSLFFLTFLSLSHPLSVFLCSFFSPFFFKFYPSLWLSPVTLVGCIGVAWPDQPFDSWVHCNVQLCSKQLGAMFSSSHIALTHRGITPVQINTPRLIVYACAEHCDY